MRIRRRFYSESIIGDNVMIERITPPKLDKTELHQRAVAISSLLHEAWREKVPDSQLSDTDLAHKIPDGIEMRDRLNHPVSEGRYYVAYLPWFFGGGDRLDPRIGALGVLRVETYRPRNPFKASYPNITDLEVRGGHIEKGSIYERTAAAMLHFAATDDGVGKVSAYELEGSDGIEFYEQFGFKQTGNHPSEIIGNGWATYVHLEAPKIGRVKAEIENEFPWLRMPIDTP